MLRIIKYIILIGLLLFGLRMLKIFFWDIPSLRVHHPTRSRLMDIRGGPAHLSRIPLSKISPYLKQAVIAAEDGRFYFHDGVDFYEMKQAFKKNLKVGRLARGGSTITMQLVKNLYFSPTKSVVRKILEIPLAYKMEKELSKDRILEIYLNVIEWGKGVYGAEEASQYYFRKPALSLNAHEASFLAAIIPNPRRWGKWPPGSRITKRMNLVSRLAFSPNGDREENEKEGKTSVSKIESALPDEPLDEEQAGDDFFVDDLEDNGSPPSQ